MHSYNLGKNLRELKENHVYETFNFFEKSYKRNNLKRSIYTIPLYWHDILYFIKVFFEHSTIFNFIFNYIINIAAALLLLTNFFFNFQVKLCHFFQSAFNKIVTDNIPIIMNLCSRSMIRTPLKQVVINIGNPEIKSGSTESKSQNTILRANC